MTTLLVDHGRVACPRHGDLDIDSCAPCRDLRDLRVAGGDRRVVCSAPPSSASPLDDIRLSLYR